MREAVAKSKLKFRFLWVSVHCKHFLIQQCCFLQERWGIRVLLVLSVECSRYCAWKLFTGRVPQRAAVSFTAWTTSCPQHSSVQRLHVKQRFCTTHQLP